jgi:hypothetical protein
MFSPGEQKKFAESMKRAFEAGSFGRDFATEWQRANESERMSQLVARFGRKNGDAKLPGFPAVRARAKSEYRFLAIASWIEANKADGSTAFDPAVAYWVQLDGWFLSLKSTFLGTTEAKAWTLEHLGKPCRAWAEFDRVVVELDGVPEPAKRWGQLPPRVVGEIGRAFVKDRPTPERSLGWVMFMNEYGLPLGKRPNFRARSEGKARPDTEPNDPQDQE